MHSVDEKTVSLKIDFREQRSGIVDELQKIDNRIKLQVCQLSTGDYWIGELIIVERKTLSDFLESIKTGRIFQQAYRMAQSGKNTLIILEGDKSMVDSALMSRKAVQGAFIHLNVFLGIPVIRSRHIRETAFLLMDIFHQCQQEALPRQKSIIHRSPGIRITKKQKEKLSLLLNIPGIGIKKGLALLQSFSSIENILNATPGDLAKVRGIGIRLGGRIFTILHEPF